MPGKDGTGPFGNKRGAGGRGRHGMGQNSKAGPSEFCVCPSCGKKIPHVPGQSCNEVVCPQCNTRMTRET